MHLYAGDVAGVVADVGSCTARFGSAGEDIPRLVFPSSVGYRAAEDGANESKVAERGAAAAQFYVGTMAMRFPRERMDIRAAMSSGDVGVTDWAVMEAVWEHALTHSMLFADPREHAVLLAESSFAPTADRAKFAELLFERFESPALYFARRAVLSAFALGRSTALVVSTRASMTTVVPVVDGHALLCAARRTPIGGRMLSAHLLRALDARGVDLAAASPRAVAAAARGVTLSASYLAEMRMNVAEDIKETLCSFALSGAMAKTPGLAASGAKPLFTLPDGTAIDLTAECFAVPELLMSGRSDDAEAAAEGEGGGRAMELEAAPEGEALPVLPQMLYDSVKECHADLRKDLLKHVLLSGAGTLMPGYKKRLAKEMASLVVDKRFHAQFIAAASLERKFGTWIGGSILASLGTFQQLWVSKAEYDEMGASIFMDRCT